MYWSGFRYCSRLFGNGCRMFRRVGQFQSLNFNVLLTRLGSKFEVFIGLLWNFCRLLFVCSWLRSLIIFLTSPHYLLGLFFFCCNISFVIGWWRWFIARLLHIFL